MDSQTSFGGDSKYYGQGGGGRPAADSTNSFRDDIPLRDHPGLPLKDSDTTDHVYDSQAPPPHMMEEGRSKRKNGFGFLKSGKKKITWVCYILTTVQVAVFIGEIIKNGMISCTLVLHFGRIYTNFKKQYSQNPLLKYTRNSIL